MESSKRNGTEHGVTVEDQEEIAKKNLITEIEYVFACNDGIIDKRIVELNNEELQELNSAQLTTYLYSLNIIIKMYSVRQKKLRIKPIEEFFRVADPATNATGNETNEIQDHTKDKSELDPGDGT